MLSKGDVQYDQFGYFQKEKNKQHKLSHHDKKLIRLSDKICKKKSGLKKS